MPDADEIDREFNAMTNRLIKREQLRRAAADLNSTSPPAIENALANISAEVTEEAAERLALEKARTAPHPSKPGS
jgi:phage shock protein A